MLDGKILVQAAYKYLTEGIYPAAASSNEMKSESLGKNIRNFLCIMANYSTREQTEAIVALR